MITKPLNLKNTYYGAKTNTAENESNSYSYMGKWTKKSETDMSIPQGAGALISTPTDLNHFIEQLFLGNIVSKESVEQMKTIKNGFGMGMFQFPYNDKVSYGHTGGIDGFQSASGYFQDDKLAISLTSNGVNYNQNNILIAVLSTFYNDPYEIPSFERIELSSEDLDKYLGTYSSEQIPLKIVLSKEENTLMAQATGQGAFPLDPISENIFTFDSAGVKMEFNPAEKTFILFQGGGEFTFKME